MIWAGEDAVDRTPRLCAGFSESGSAYHTDWVSLSHARPALVGIEVAKCTRRRMPWVRAVLLVAPPERRASAAINPLAPPGLLMPSYAIEGSIAAGDCPEEETMAEIERLAVAEARNKTKAQAALLVCAYEDEAKWNKMQREGAIPLAGLGAWAATLPKDQEIILYAG